MRGILAKCLLLNGLLITNIREMSRMAAELLRATARGCHMWEKCLGRLKTRDYQPFITIFSYVLSLFEMFVCLVDGIYERAVRDARDIINGRKRHAHNYSINYEKYEINDASNFGMDRLLTTSMRPSYSIL